MSKEIGMEEREEVKEDATPGSAPDGLRPHTSLQGPA
jgi:hypothetical protein